MFDFSFKIDFSIPISVFLIGYFFCRHKPHRKFMMSQRSLRLQNVCKNQTEIPPESIWKSGWRLFAAWTGVVVLCWGLVVYPWLSLLFAIIGIEISLPKIPDDVLLNSLYLMLGLSVIRSFEKFKGLTK